MGLISNDDLLGANSNCFNQKQHPRIEEE